MDAREAITLVNRIYTRLSARRSEIRMFEDYYNGKHKLTFATKEWMEANSARYSGFSDNWTATVVNAEAERLEHRGLLLPPEFKDGAKTLWRDWVANDMESQSSQGFLESLMAKRSYVIVWGDEDGSPIQTWEHPANVEIEYDFDTLRHRRAALKTWIDETKEYATLYTPHEVWKFQRGRNESLNERAPQSAQASQISSWAGGWVPRPVRGETWPVKNPLGVVPVVEIPNRPVLRGEPVSELAGVIPLQDAINLLWAYLFLSADYASLPARVVLQSGPPKIPILDKNGNNIGSRPVVMKDLAEKRLSFFEGANAKIDQWDAADLAQFPEIIEMAVGHIAAQTRTPPHYLITNKGLSNLSGDALKSAEIGLVQKAGEFKMFASPGLREIHRLSALVRGDMALAEAVRYASMEWRNSEIQSDAQMADALAKKRSIGYPFEYLLELDGVEPKDIDRIMSMREAEMLDPQIDAAMRGLNDSGNIAESI